MKINNFYPIATTGKIDDSFVGLKIKGNDIYFYYPETYHFERDNEDYNVSSILNLLKTISIAKTKSKETNLIYNSHSDEGEFALYSYLWLIKDWLNNGFYVNREKEYKVNQKGKVNWKRTLNQQPIISSSNIIYNNIVVEIKSSIEDILLEIHKYCIKKSIDYIGWLFNINSKKIITVKLNDKLKKKYVRVLKNELKKTFDDVKKMRLNHMLNALIGVDGDSDEKEFVYGVDSYHYIFEKMIDYIFGTEKDLSKFNPKAAWKLYKPLEKEKVASELRPDTIIIKDKTAYILDSKFYRFGFTGEINDLPETTSIQKQITYGDYLVQLNKKDDIDVDQILSAFILPYDKTMDKFKLDDNIQYIGYAKTEWKNEEEEHQYIYTFLIDLYHVVEVWNAGNSTEDVDYLIEEINKAISSR